MSNETPAYKALFEYSCIAIIGILIALLFSWCERSQLQNEVDSLNATVSEMEAALNDHIDYNFIFCHQCGSSIPDIYTVTDGKHNICPDCTYNASSEVLSPKTGKCFQCNALYSYNFSHGLGLCDDCGDAQITTCMFCNNPTYVWEGTYWDGICPHCMGIIATETKLYSLLEDFSES